MFQELLHYFLCGPKTVTALLFGTSDDVNGWVFVAFGPIDDSPLVNKRPQTLYFVFLPVTPKDRCAELQVMSFVLYCLNTEIVSRLWVYTR